MTNKYFYPEMFDQFWMATDAVGHVAVLITAGLGAIPESCFNLTDPNNWNLWKPGNKFVLSTPIISEVAWACEDLSNWDGYVRRGVFLYEWTDIYRSGDDYTRSYEIQGKPATPRKLFDFVQDPVILSRIPNFPTIEFAKSPSVDVLALVPCVVSERM